MTQTASNMVREFHEKYGHPVLTEPTIPAWDREELREALIAEELEELRDAQEMRSVTEEERRAKLTAVADALGDLIYVVEGAALEYGIDLSAVVAEIHRSNLTKLGDDGRPIYSSLGKVEKGANFEEPNLSSVLW